MRQSPDNHGSSQKDVVSGGHGAGHSNLSKVDRRLIGADTRVQPRLVATVALAIFMVFFGCRTLDQFARGGNTDNPYLKITPGSYGVHTRTPAPPTATPAPEGAVGRPVVVNALEAAATPTHRPARYFCPASYERDVCNDWAAVVQATPWVTFVYGE